MKSRKKLLMCICLSFFAFTAFAIPPYMWWSTYSVQTYNGNVCHECGGDWPYVPLKTPNLEAQGFYNAMTNYSSYMNNQSKQYMRTEADVTGARWTGANAEINYNDFIFYAGHGWAFGPVFLNCVEFDPRSDIRFGGNHYLKWVQAATCEWFVAPEYGCDVSEVDRWSNSFTGVHAVMGHRAITYDTPYPNEESDGFFSRWIVSGQTLYESWVSAQIDWVYHNGDWPVMAHGLQPAVMGHHFGYNDELWANAGDAQASGTKTCDLSWRTVGRPEYL